MDLINYKIKEILNEVHRCQATVMNEVESALGNSEVWPQLRVSILRAFGDRGLKGKLKSSIEECDLIIKEYRGLYQPEKLRRND